MRIIIKDKLVSCVSYSQLYHVKEKLEFVLKYKKCVKYKKYINFIRHIVKNNLVGLNNKLNREIDEIQTQCLEELDSSEIEPKIEDEVLSEDEVLLKEEREHGNTI